MPSAAGRGWGRSTRWRTILAVGVLVALAVPPAIGHAPTAAPTVSEAMRAMAGTSDTPTARSAAAPATAVPAVPAQTPGLRVSGTTTYRLDIETGAIEVHAEVTLENTRPPDGRFFYYFHQFGLPAAGPVANLRANHEGTPLATHLEEDEFGLVFVVVDLAPRLNYGNVQRIEIGYELPAQPNGSHSPTRVNDAFASWWVFATGDDGTGRVVIDVPDRFEVEVGTGLQPGTATTDGRRILEFDDFDEFDGIFGVTAHDNERLLARSVEVADTEFTIRAWPGDEEWADFVADAVVRGIPALVDFIGVDIDDDRDLEIIETATPYIYGYAGWYDRIGGFIEVGDERDLAVIMHELSHIWFHGQLFNDRWLLEGLAEVSANRVIDSMGGEAEPVPAIDFSAPGAVPLSQWGAVSVLDGDPVSELWGYAMSYAVMDHIIETIGEDTMRAVLARAADRELPLLADGADDLRRVRDWRYFYDLIDTETDATDVRAILTEYVVTDEHAAAFDHRDEAMARYHGLVDDGDGWAPPYAVRSSLGRWTFDNAVEAMDAAAAVLALRDDLDELIEPSHRLSLDGLRDAYAEARGVGDLTGIADAHDDYVAAATAVGDVEARVDGANPIQRFGLWNRIDAHRDAARVAFGAGDFDEVYDRLARAESAIDEAAVVGLVRGVAAAGVAGLWVGVVGLVIGRRRTATHLSDSGA